MLDPTWTDEDGVVRRVPRRLDYRIPAHAAIRAFVARRDLFMCGDCATRAFVPCGYDGRDAPLVRGVGPLHVDHMVARSRGGTNHPSNLQMLCEPCNCRKGATLDKAVA